MENSKLANAEKPSAVMQHMHIRLMELSAREFRSKLKGTFFGVLFMLGY